MRAAGGFAACCALACQASAFLLPSARVGARPATALAAFPVKFITPTGEERVVTVDAGSTLLEAAEAANIEAPHSCRTGLCTECAGLVVSGMDGVHLEAAVLDPEVTAQGFILTCSATAKGEGIVIELGAGDRMYEAQYGDFRRDHESMQTSKKPGLFAGIPFGAQEAA